jgi:broad specificity phosphatase PhoE
VTTTFFLVRHAAHDNVGNFLAGRSRGISLGEAGRAQAKRLAQRMTRERFDAIHASPRERTQETAAALSEACGVAPVKTAEALDEIDFGSWSGKTFEVLNADPAWRRWNDNRSMARAPGGETMLDVQQRIVGFMEQLAASGGGKRLVLVSHGDVIKAAVSYVLGLPIDAWSRFDIGPASITTVATGDWGAKVLTLNEVVS